MLHQIFMYFDEVMLAAGLPPSIHFTLYPPFQLDKQTGQKKRMVAEIAKWFWEVVINLESGSNKAREGR